MSVDADRRARCARSATRRSPSSISSGEACRFYKIGVGALHGGGPAIVREVRARGADVFLDLKFHDIPNTVAGAVRRAAAVGRPTAHRARRRRADDAAGRRRMQQAIRRCGVLAVTVLTSLDEAECRGSLGSRRAAAHRG